MTAVATSAGVPALAGDPPKGGAATKPKAAPTASASASATAAPAPADGPEAWFAEGAAAHKAGRFAEAEALFLKAWAVKKTWDVAANLGLAQVNLGKHVEAAEHLAYALQWFPASELAATKEVLERRLKSAREEIGALTVTVNVDGAEVRVNGEVKGTSPLQAELFVAPGDVTIEASKSGYEPVRRKLTVAKGANETPALTLAPTAPKDRNKLPAYVIGGAGIAALIAGGVLIGVAESTKSGLSAEAPRGPDGKPVCWTTPKPGGATAECDAFRAKIGTVNTEGDAGIGLLIGGGALLGVAAAYWLWPSGGGSKDVQGSKIVPVVGPTGGAVMWTGSF